MHQIGSLSIEFYDQFYNNKVFLPHSTLCIVILVEVLIKLYDFSRKYANEHAKFDFRAATCVCNKLYISSSVI